MQSTFTAFTSNQFLQLNTFTQRWHFKKSQSLLQKGHFHLEAFHYGSNWRSVNMLIIGFD